MVNCSPYVQKARGKTKHINYRHERYKKEPTWLKDKKYSIWDKKLLDEINSILNMADEKSMNLKTK